MLGVQLLVKSALEYGGTTVDEKLVKNAIHDFLRRSNTVLIRTNKQK